MESKAFCYKDFTFEELEKHIERQKFIISELTRAGHTYEPTVDLLRIYLQIYGEKHYYRKFKEK